MVTSSGLPRLLWEATLVATMPSASRKMEVITANTRLDPAPAAAEMGMQLTGLDEMIQNSLEEVERT